MSNVTRVAASSKASFLNLPSYLATSTLSPLITSGLLGLSGSTLFFMFNTILSPSRVFVYPSAPTFTKLSGSQVKLIAKLDGSFTT